MLRDILSNAWWQQMFNTHTSSECLLLTVDFFTLIHRQCIRGAVVAKYKHVKVVRQCNAISPAPREGWWSGKRRWCGVVRGPDMGLRRCVCHQKNVSTASAPTCWDVSESFLRGRQGDRAGRACQEPAALLLLELIKRRKMNRLRGLFKYWQFSCQGALKSPPMTEPSMLQLQLSRSCVKHGVSVRLKRSRSSLVEKVACSAPLPRSTTVPESPCLDTCLWNTRSSIVPARNQCIVL